MAGACQTALQSKSLFEPLGRLRVRRALDRIAIERGLPEAIVLDDGLEFRGRALAAWSEERGVPAETENSTENLHRD